MYVIFKKITGESHSIKSWPGFLILLFIALVYFSMYTDDKAIEAKKYLLKQDEIIKQYGESPSAILSESRHAKELIDLNDIKHEGYSRYIFSIAGNGKYDTVSVYVYSDATNKEMDKFTLESPEQNDNN